MKKQTNSTIKAHLLRGAFTLLLLLGVGAIPFALAQPGSIVTEIPTSSGLAPSRPEMSSKASHPAAAKLTFADRAAYQRAIEDVYWRHRIWPKERPDPKPSLDAMMSQAQIEKKVEDYLRNSQALEDYWQRPISADQLQAEMQRMASHTKQPEVLHEIFEALGNDPFVVAECLARPVLAERFANGDPVAAHMPPTQPTRLPPQKPALAGWLAKTETRVPVTMAAMSSANYTLPAIASPSGGCIDDTWTPTSTTNAPTGRSRHTAVWTGSEMIVWGGCTDSLFCSNRLNSGGRYNPITYSWTATSTTNAPTARTGHTAVWSGGEMIVWGGQAMFGNRLNTGGRYNPSTDSWTATSTTNAPTGRYSPTAVWTGSEMIVWGGSDDHGQPLNTGGRYDPGTDSWTATSTTNAPEGRFLHTAVWTGSEGSEMIVWGGGVNTGGRYCAPPPVPFTLSAAGRKVGGINTVRLNWSGATSTNIDVYRDGMPIVRTANDGSYVDSTGDTGRARYTYRVCEAGTATCSDDARVTFRQ